MRIGKQHSRDGPMMAALGKPMSEIDKQTQAQASVPNAPHKKLTPAAERALAEAAARRAAAPEQPERPKEALGPRGPEPVRYGDWENKGIASDF
jgi:hypothetical protein